MMQRNRIRSLIAGVILAVFSYSSVLHEPLYGMTTLIRERDRAREAQEKLEGFVLPYRFGRITDGGYGDGRRLVVYIQDLHCHPEVQKNIYELIRWFDTRYGVKRILVEGAPAGKVDTGVFSAIRGDEIRKRTLDNLLSKGLLSGAEYYSVVHREDKLYGLEQWDVYLGNLKRIQRFLGEKERNAAVGERINGLLRGLKAKHLAFELRRLEKTLDPADDGKQASAKRYFRLEKLGRKVGEGTGDYPNLDRFIRMMRLNREIRFRRLPGELSRVLADLKAVLPYGVYRALLEKLDQGGRQEEYYLGLAGIAAEYAPRLGTRYPEAARFLEYVRLNYAVNPVRLVAEEESYRHRVLRRYARRLVDEELLFLSRMGTVFQHLVELKVTVEELDYFREHAERFRVLLQKYLPYAEARDALRLLDDRELLAFYDTNLIRNDIFVKNVLAATPHPHPLPHSPARPNDRPQGEREQKDRSTHVSGRSPLPEVGEGQGEGEQSHPGYREVLSRMGDFTDIEIVVTGGFHSDITHAFRGASYLAVTPNVTRDYDESVYEKVLTGRIRPGDVAGSAFAPVLKSVGLSPDSPGVQHEITMLAESILSTVGPGSGVSPREAYRAAVDFIAAMNEELGRRGVEARITCSPNEDGDLVIRGGDGAECTLSIDERGVTVKNVKEPARQAGDATARRITIDGTVERVEPLEAGFTAGDGSSSRNSARDARTGMRRFTGMLVLTALLSGLLNLGAPLFERGVGFAARAAQEQTILKPEAERRLDLMAYDYLSNPPGGVLISQDIDDWKAVVRAKGYDVDPEKFGLHVIDLFNRAIGAIEAEGGKPMSDTVLEKMIELVAPADRARKTRAGAERTDLSPEARKTRAAVESLLKNELSDYVVLVYNGADADRIKRQREAVLAKAGAVDGRLSSYLEQMLHGTQTLPAAAFDRVSDAVDGLNGILTRPEFGYYVTFVRYGDGRTRFTPFRIVESKEYGAGETKTSVFYLSQLALNVRSLQTGHFMPGGKNVYVVRDFTKERSSDIGRVTGGLGKYYASEKRAHLALLEDLARGIVTEEFGGLNPEQVLHAVEFGTEIHELRHLETEREGTANKLEGYGDGNIMNEVFSELTTLADSPHTYFELLQLMEGVASDKSWYRPSAVIFRELSQELGLKLPCDNPEQALALFKKLREQKKEKLREAARAVYARLAAKVGAGPLETGSLVDALKAGPGAPRRTFNILQAVYDKLKKKEQLTWREKLLYAVVHPLGISPLILETFLLAGLKYLFGLAFFDPTGSVFAALATGAAFSLVHPDLYERGIGIQARWMRFLNRMAGGAVLVAPFLGLSLGLPVVESALLHAGWNAAALAGETYDIPLARDMRVQSLTGTPPRHEPSVAPEPAGPESRKALERFTASVERARNPQEVDGALRELEEFIRVAQRGLPGGENVFVALQEVNRRLIPRGYMLGMHPMMYAAARALVLYAFDPRETEIVESRKGPATVYYVRQVTRFPDNELVGPLGWNSYFEDFVVVNREKAAGLLTLRNTAVVSDMPFFGSNNPTSSEGMIADILASFCAGLWRKGLGGLDPAEAAAVHEEVCRRHELEHIVQRRILGTREGDTIYGTAEEVLADARALMDSREPLHALVRLVENYVVGRSEPAWLLLGHMAESHDGEGMAMWLSYLLDLPPDRAREAVREAARGAYAEAEKEWLEANRDILGRSADDARSGKRTDVRKLASIVLLFVTLSLPMFANAGQPYAGSLIRKPIPLHELAAARADGLREEVLGLYNEKLAGNRESERALKELVETDPEALFALLGVFKVSIMDPDPYLKTLDPSHHYAAARDNADPSAYAALAVMGGKGNGEARKRVNLDDFGGLREKLERDPAVLDLLLTRLDGFRIGMHPLLARLGTDGISRQAREGDPVALHALLSLEANHGNESARRGIVPLDEFIPELNRRLGTMDSDTIGRVPAILLWAHRYGPLRIDGLDWDTIIKRGKPSHEFAHEVIALFRRSSAEGVIPAFAGMDVSPWKSWLDSGGESYVAAFADLNLLADQGNAAARDLLVNYAWDRTGLALGVMFDNEESQRIAAILAVKYSHAGARRMLREKHKPLHEAVGKLLKSQPDSDGQRKLLETIQTYLEEHPAAVLWTEDIVALALQKQRLNQETRSALSDIISRSHVNLGDTGCALSAREIALLACPGEAQAGERARTQEWLDRLRRSDQEFTRVISRLAFYFVDDLFASGEYDLHDVLSVIELMDLADRERSEFDGPVKLWSLAVGVVKEHKQAGIPYSRASVNTGLDRALAYLAANVNRPFFSLDDPRQTVFIIAHDEFRQEAADLKSALSGQEGARAGIHLYQGSGDAAKDRKTLKRLHAELAQTGGRKVLVVFAHGRKDGFVIGGETGLSDRDFGSLIYDAQKQGNVENVFLGPCFAQNIWEGATKSMQERARKDNAVLRSPLVVASSSKDRTGYNEWSLLEKPGITVGGLYRGREYQVGYGPFGFFFPRDPSIEQGQVPDAGKRPSFILGERGPEDGALKTAFALVRRALRNQSVVVALLVIAASFLAGQGVESGVLGTASLGVLGTLAPGGKTARESLRERFERQVARAEQEVLDSLSLTRDQAKFTVFVTGSVARGDDRETSDIDYAIICDPRTVPPGFVDALSEKIDEGELPTELVHLVSGNIDDLDARLPAVYERHKYMFLDMIPVSDGDGVIREFDEFRSRLLENMEFSSVWYDLVTSADTLDRKLSRGKQPGPKELFRVLQIFLYSQRVRYKLSEIDPERIIDRLRDRGVLTADEALTLKTFRSALIGGMQATDARGLNELYRRISGTMRRGHVVLGPEAFAGLRQLAAGPYRDRTLRQVTAGKGVPQEVSRPARLLHTAFQAVDVDGDDDGTIAEFWEKYGEGTAESAPDGTLLRRIAAHLPVILGLATLGLNSYFAAGTPGTVDLDAAQSGLFAMSIFGFPSLRGLRSRAELPDEGMLFDGNRRLWQELLGDEYWGALSGIPGFDAESLVRATPAREGTANELFLFIASLDRTVLFEAIRSDPHAFVSLMTKASRSDAFVRHVGALNKAGTIWRPMEFGQIRDIGDLLALQLAEGLRDRLSLLLRRGVRLLTRVFMKAVNRIRKPFLAPVSDLTGAFEEVLSLQSAFVRAIREGERAAEITPAVTPRLVDFRPSFGTSPLAAMKASDERLRGADPELARTLLKVMRRRFRVSYDQLYQQVMQDPATIVDSLPPDAGSETVVSNALRLSRLHYEGFPLPILLFLLGRGPGVLEALERRTRIIWDRRGLSGCTLPLLEWLNAHGDDDAALLSQRMARIYNDSSMMKSFTIERDEIEWIMDASDELIAAASAGGSLLFGDDYVRNSLTLDTLRWLAETDEPVLRRAAANRETLWSVRPNLKGGFDNRVLVLMERPRVLMVMSSLDRAETERIALLSKACDGRLTADMQTLLLYLVEKGGKAGVREDVFALRPEELVKWEHRHADELESLAGIAYRFVKSGLGAGGIRLVLEVLRKRDLSAIAALKDVPEGLLGADGTFSGYGRFLAGGDAVRKKTEIAVLLSDWIRMLNAFSGLPRSREGSGVESEFQDIVRAYGGGIFRDDGEPGMRQALEDLRRKYGDELLPLLIDQGTGEINALFASGGASAAGISAVITGMKRWLLREMTGEDIPEHLFAGKDVLDRLMVMVSVYHGVPRLDFDDADAVQERLREALGVYLRAGGDAGAVREWMLSLPENRKEMERLVRKGYDPDLWKDGITVRGIASSGMSPEELQAQRTRHAHQILEIAKTMGLISGQELTSRELGSHREASDFVRDVIRANRDKALPAISDPAEREDRLEEYEANLEDILREFERLELAQGAVSADEEVTVEIGKDFLEEGSSGLGVPGCFNPYTGIHREMPVMHAFESNALFARAYDSRGRQIANVVLALTDRGVVVFGDYNRTSLNLAPLWTEAWKELAAMSPGVILGRTSAGRSRCEPLAERRRPRSAVKRATIWTDPYFDFGDVDDGDVKFANRNAVIMTRRSIERNGGERETAALHAAWQAKRDELVRTAAEEERVRNERKTAGIAAFRDRLGKALAGDPALKPFLPVMGRIARLSSPDEVTFESLSAWLRERDPQVPDEVIGRIWNLVEGSRDAGPAPSADVRRPAPAESGDNARSDDAPGAAAAGGRLVRAVVERLPVIIGLLGIGLYGWFSGDQAAGADMIQSPLQAMGFFGITLFGRSKSGRNKYRTSARARQTIRAPPDYASPYPARKQGLRFRLRHLAALTVVAALVWGIVTGAMSGYRFAQQIPQRYHDELCAVRLIDPDYGLLRERAGRGDPAAVSILMERFQNGDDEVFGILTGIRDPAAWLTIFDTMNADAKLRDRFMHYCNAIVRDLRNDHLGPRHVPLETVWKDLMKSSRGNPFILYAYFTSRENIGGTARGMFKELQKQALEEGKDLYAFLLERDPNKVLLKDFLLNAAHFNILPEMIGSKASLQQVMNDLFRDLSEKDVRSHAARVAFFVETMAGKKDFRYQKDFQEYLLKLYAGTAGVHQRLLAAVLAIYGDGMQHIFPAGDPKERAKLEKIRSYHGISYQEEGIPDEVLLNAGRVHVIYADKDAMPHMRETLKFFGERGYDVPKVNPEKSSMIVMKRNGGGREIVLWNATRSPYVIDEALASGVRMFAYRGHAGGEPDVFPERVSPRREAFLAWDFACWSLSHAAKIKEHYRKARVVVNTDVGYGANADIVLYYSLDAIDKGVTTFQGMKRHIGDGHLEKNIRDFVFEGDRSLAVEQEVNRDLRMSRGQAPGQRGAVSAGMLAALLSGFAGVFGFLSFAAALGLPPAAVAAFGILGFSGAFAVPGLARRAVRPRFASPAGESAPQGMENRGAALAGERVNEPQGPVQGGATARSRWRTMLTDSFDFRGLAFAAARRSVPQVSAAERRLSSVRGKVNIIALSAENRGYAEKLVSEQRNAGIPSRPLFVTWDDGTGPGSAAAQAKLNITIEGPDGTPVNVALRLGHRPVDRTENGERVRAGVMVTVGVPDAQTEPASNSAAAWELLEEVRRNKGLRDSFIARAAVRIAEEKNGAGYLREALRGFGADGEAWLVETEAGMERTVTSLALGAQGAVPRDIVLGAWDGVEDARSRFGSLLERYSLRMRLFAEPERIERSARDAGGSTRTVLMVRALLSLGRVGDLVGLAERTAREGVSGIVVGFSFPEAEGGRSYEQAATGTDALSVDWSVVLRDLGRDGALVRSLAERRNLTDAGQARDLIEGLVFRFEEAFAERGRTGRVETVRLRETVREIVAVCLDAGYDRLADRGLSEPERERALWFAQNRLLRDRGAVVTDDAARRGLDADAESLRRETFIQRLGIRTVRDAVRDGRQAGTDIVPYLGRLRPGDDGRHTALFLDAGMFWLERAPGVQLDISELGSREAGALLLTLARQRETAVRDGRVRPDAEVRVECAPELREIVGSHGFTAVVTADRLSLRALALGGASVLVKVADGGARELLGAALRSGAEEATVELGGVSENGDVLPVPPAVGLGRGLGLLDIIDALGALMPVSRVLTPAGRFAAGMRWGERAQDMPPLDALGRLFSETVPGEPAVRTVEKLLRSAAETDRQEQTAAAKKIVDGLGVRTLSAAWNEVYADYSGARSQEERKAYAAELLGVLCGVFGGALVRHGGVPLDGRTGRDRQALLAASAELGGYVFVDARGRFRLAEGTDRLFVLEALPGILKLFDGEARRDLVDDAMRGIRELEARGTIATIEWLVLAEAVFRSGDEELMRGKLPLIEQTLRSRWSGEQGVLDGFRSSTLPAGEAAYWLNFLAALSSEPAFRREYRAFLAEGRGLLQETIRTAVQTGLDEDIADRSHALGLARQVLSLSMADMLPPSELQLMLGSPEEQERMVREMEVSRSLKLPALRGVLRQTAKTAAEADLEIDRLRQGLREESLSSLPLTKPAPEAAAAAVMLLLEPPVLDHDRGVKETVEKGMNGAFIESIRLVLTAG